MVTDQRTGMRTIRAARETFAAVALTGLTVATVLRCVEGRAGAFAGILLTVMALAVLSRWRVSWDEETITCQTAFTSRRRFWSEFSDYSADPEPRDDDGFQLYSARRRSGFLAPCRLRIHGRRGDLVVNLKPFSWQDIRHLQDRIATEVPLRERSGVLVS